MEDFYHVFIMGILLSTLGCSKIGGAPPRVNLQRSQISKNRYFPITDSWWKTKISTNTCTCSRRSVHFRGLSSQRSRVRGYPKFPTDTQCSSIKHCDKAIIFDFLEFESICHYSSECDWLFDTRGKQKVLQQTLDTSELTHVGSVLCQIPHSKIWGKD